jgi:hypothetical protein
MAVVKVEVLLNSLHGTRSGNEALLSWLPDAFSVMLVVKSTKHNEN